MFSSFSLSLNLDLREFVNMSESDAHQFDASAPLTSRHADFVIAWATVEGDILFASQLYFHSKYTYEYKKLSITL